MAKKFDRESNEKFYDEEYNEEEVLEGDDYYEEVEDEDEVEEEADKGEEAEKEEDWEDGSSGKVDASFACDDCDYRWDDLIDKEEDEAETHNTVCPMCGSMNITQI